MNDWPEWLQRLPAGRGQHAQRVRRVLEDLGCEDPSGWARSEIEENIPQLARYRFLHTLWPRMIDGWREGTTQAAAAQRALQAGATLDDLVQFARLVAYETVVAMLVHLEDDQGTEGLPAWMLMETDSTGTSTGRQVGGLCEDVLGLDPSGREGRDLWA